MHWCESFAFCVNHIKTTTPPRFSILPLGMEAAIQKILSSNIDLNENGEYLLFTIKILTFLCLASPINGISITGLQKCQ